MSALIIGKNGAGKSALRQALMVFQQISRGPNRVKNWIEANDFTQHRKHIPMRFEVELTLSGKRFKYIISFEMPERFREPRVVEESLSADGNAVFSRRLSDVTLSSGTTFGLDWHVAALPVVSDRAADSLIRQIKSFFATMILVSPTPGEMSGYSEDESFELRENAGNFAECLNALLSQYPAAYVVLFEYLKAVIPDLSSFQNEQRGERGKQLLVNFEKEGVDQGLSLEFKKLSDGEKCFFLSAVIVASNKVAGPVFCMWDEPDNHLSLPEIGHFILQLRRLAHRQGQFLATSHHPETIRRFSDDSTLVFTRQSHLEPTVVRPLTDIPYSGDLIQALVRDEVIG
jgi:ABC-type cobalamin/Fe3+-siderophores transport system ATPase subunit